MLKNLFKIGFTALGCIILVDCIVGEVDGVGRFAMIVSGVLFSVIGSAIPFEKRRK